MFKSCRNLFDLSRKLRSVVIGLGLAGTAFSGKISAVNPDENSSGVHKKVLDAAYSAALDECRKSEHLLISFIDVLSSQNRNMTDVANNMKEKIFEQHHDSTLTQYCKGLSGGYIEKIPEDISAERESYDQPIRSFKWTDLTVKNDDPDFSEYFKRGCFERLRLRKYFNFEKLQIELKLEENPDISEQFKREYFERLQTELKKLEDPDVSKELQTELKKTIDIENPDISEQFEQAKVSSLESRWYVIATQKGSNLVKRRMEQARRMNQVLKCIEKILEDISAERDSYDQLIRSFKWTDLTVKNDDPDISKQFKPFKELQTELKELEDPNCHRCFREQNLIEVNRELQKAKVLLELRRSNLVERRMNQALKDLSETAKIKQWNLGDITPLDFLSVNYLPSCNLDSSGSPFFPAFLSSYRLSKRILVLTDTTSNARTILWENAKRDKPWDVPYSEESLSDLAARISKFMMDDRSFIFGCDDKYYFDNRKDFLGRIKNFVRALKNENLSDIEIENDQLYILAASCCNLSERCSKLITSLWTGPGEYCFNAPLCQEYLDTMDDKYFFHELS